MTERPAALPADPSVPAATPPGAVPTLAWREGPAAGVLELLDQTLLPHRSEVVRCASPLELRDAIRRLAVRGAPAIGVAGAYGTVLAAQCASSAADPIRAFAEGVETVRSARPTAVNLAWAVDRCVAAASTVSGLGAKRSRLLAEARAVHAEDEASCVAMGRLAAQLLPPDGTFLTHCNTGRLATAGCGTAFAAFATLRARGHHPSVFVGEVRPLLQGARLTIFELEERGIEATLLPDSAAAALLASGRIDAVLTGADRIARNGDAANKIGTYSLAVLARHHGVPFHVVAPESTIDRGIADGTSIPIEERAAEEVLGFAGVRTAARGCGVFNPAFDVTPASLLSTIVTDRAVHRAPFSF